MTEHQLSRLLQDETPEPPASIDLERMAARIQHQAIPVRRRWLMPVTAAAAVVTVVAAGVGIAALTRDSGAAPTTAQSLGPSATPPTGPAPMSADSGTQKALARAQDVLRRWEQQTAGNAFIPAGPSWAFQRIGSTTGPEHAYAEALDARKIVLGASLSSENPPAGTVRWDDGSTRAVDVRSAEATVRDLLTGATPCTNCQTLRVLDATLTTMRIQTTRGAATIPAWRYSFAGTQVQALQAAVTARVQMSTAASGETVADDIVPVNRAELAADDVTLTIHLYGAYSPASRPCGVDYNGYAVESERAVGVVVLQHRNPTPVPCPMPLKPADRTVRITLSTPLEDRAVLDTATGIAIPVTHH